MSEDGRSRSSLRGDVYGACVEFTAMAASVAVLVAGAWQLWSFGAAIGTPAAIGFCLIGTPILAFLAILGVVAGAMGQGGESPATWSTPQFLGNLAGTVLIVCALHGSAVGVILLARRFTIGW